MAFAYSAGVITQTATDTGLSGLNGLTGVTRIGYVTTGSESFYIYDIGTNRLDIEGDLTINPEYNMLLTNCPTGIAPNMSINVRSTGTLTLGVKTVVGSATKYTIGTAIIATEQGNLNSDGSLHVESGGTLEGYGATIELSGPTRLRNGSYVTVEDLTVIIASNGETQFRIEHSGANTANVSLTNNGIKMNGKGSADEANLTTTGSNAFDPDSFIFSFIKAKYQPGASGYPPQVFLNFDNGNNVANADFSYAGSGGTGGTDFNGILVDFRNVARRLRYTNANIKGGFCQTTKNVNFNLVDENFVGITDVAYYAVDTDNGGRINFNLFDSTADLVYTDSDVGPLVSISPVVEYMAGESTTRFIDDRLDSDTITFRFISYLTNISSSSPNLIGLGDLDLDIVNPSDASITEINKVTVDTYTEIETAAKFYDRAKAYLYDNFSGEISTVVARSGNAINAGSYDVDIDATAASAYDLTGNTITIKTTQFIGSITTAGTFTLSNGATLVGTVVSSSVNFTTISAAFNNLTDATIEIFDNSGTSVDRVTAQTGTCTYYTPSTATGTWTYVIDRIGYAPKMESFNPSGANISVDGALAQLLRADGSVMYTGTSSADVAVTFDFVTPSMCIEIGDAQVDTQTVFDEAEQSLLTVDGMRWQNTYGTLTRYDDLPGVGRILFLQDNIRLKRALAEDVNAGVTGYVLSTQGTPVDGTNGSVAIVAGFAASDVWAVATRTLTAGTKDTEIDSIKAKTDQLNFTGLDVQSVASNMRGTDGANTTTPPTAAQNADAVWDEAYAEHTTCLLYTSPSPRDGLLSRMPSSA